MIRRSSAALIVALLAAGTAPPGAAQDPKPANDPNAPLAIRINQAIDSGVRWLSDKDGKEKKLIFAPGNWSNEITSTGSYDPGNKGDPLTFPTGCTSLALYTLLKCGVPKEDPVIQKGFQWLRTGRGSASKGKGLATEYRIPNSTYEIAVLILALEAKANPHKREAERERELKFKLKKGEKLKTGVKLDPEDDKWMRDLTAQLMNRANRGAAWRYGYWNGSAWNNGVRANSDMSASQFAMLALMAAERCGIPQKDEFYVSILNWTLGLQEKEGPETPRWTPSPPKDADPGAGPMDRARGWGYLSSTGGDTGPFPDENVATGSMTCCGLANILIATGILEARESKAYGPDLQSRAERGWWDGVAWLHQNWTVERNVNKNSYHKYYLYCLERVCDMKRISLLAGHPWYNEGAQVLVDEQDPATGAWIRDDSHGPHELLGTCFALLFLNRSTPAITSD